MRSLCPIWNARTLQEQKGWSPLLIQICVRCLVNMTPSREFNFPIWDSIYCNKHKWRHPLSTRLKNSNRDGQPKLSSTWAQFNSIHGDLNSTQTSTQISTLNWNQNPFQNVTKNETYNSTQNSMSGLRLHAFSIEYGKLFSPSVLSGRKLDSTRSSNLKWAQLKSEFDSTQCRIRILPQLKEQLRSRISWVEKPAELYTQGFCAWP